MKYVFFFIVINLGCCAFTQHRSSMMPAQTVHCPADTLSPTWRSLSQSVAYKNPVFATAPAIVLDETIDEKRTVIARRNIAICKGNGFFLGGKPRFISGVFRDTLVAVDGRDSVLVTELSVLNCKSL